MAEEKNQQVSKVKNTGVGVSAARSGARESMRCGQKAPRKPEEKQPPKTQIVVHAKFKDRMKKDDANLPTDEVEVEGAKGFVNDGAKFTQAAHYFESEQLAKVAADKFESTVPNLEYVKIEDVTETE